MLRLLYLSHTFLSRASTAERRQIAKIGFSFDVFFFMNSENQNYELKYRGVYTFLLIILEYLKSIEIVEYIITKYLLSLF